MRRTLKIFIITIIAYCVVVFAVCVVAVGIFQVRWQDMLTNKWVYIISAIVCAIIPLVVVIQDIFKNNNVLKENNHLENSRWMTHEDMRKNKGFIITKFSKLDTVDDGIPIHAKKGILSKDLNVILKEGIHTIVIGATGTGKTSAFVSPTIEILARTKTKPSMVITDPKGELYDHHAAILRANGYKIATIDLTDIMHSTRWNPFNDIISKTSMIVTSDIEYRGGKYYIGDTCYPTREDADAATKGVANNIENEIFIDLQDFIETMCPLTDKHDPSWQTAARNFIFGILLAMWEDLRDGYMDKKDFNLYTLYKTITEYAVGECEVLAKYIETRKTKSKVKSLTNTVIEAKDKTKASYLAEVNTFNAWLSDSGITALTSDNEINLSNFDESPNVIFLKIPDDKQNRYKLVSLFVTQMYKSLIAKSDYNRRSGKNKSQKLLRNVYLIMDEFGNLPKINVIDKVATIGRGRGIFMIPIIQDFNQLYHIYGKEVADTIRSNCNIQLFIGTNDKNTINEFSEQCGRRKVRSMSTSSNGKDTSVSASATSVPLIYPSELEQLNDPKAGKAGNIIALCLGTYPIKSKITPIYAAKTIYQLQDTQYVSGKQIVFDESKFYDISRTSLLFDQEQNDSSEQDTQENNIEENLHNIKLEVFNQKYSAYEKMLQRLLSGVVGRISEQNIKQLKHGYYSQKISLLGKLIDETNDSFLLCDLAKIREFIQTNFEFERVEIEKENYEI